MEIKVNYYGKLAEIAGKSSEIISIEESSVLAVKKTLEQNYISMTDLTYQIAESNAILNENDSILTKELDIFPPFSGG